MFDWLADFLQAIYNVTIGEIRAMWDFFTSFISFAWDFVLIFAIAYLAFMIWRFARYFLVAFSILIQITMVSGIVTAIAAFLILLPTALVAIYNRIMSLADYISSSPGIGCLGYSLDCLGISGILGTYLTELFALFVLALLLRLSSLFIASMKYIADVFHSIAVQIGSL